MDEAPESPRGSRYVYLGVGGIIVLAAILFLAGITWGLPSRATDSYLFGGRPAWPGTKIAELVHADRRSDTRRGADVDVNPIGPTTRPVALNDTDEKRAAIILRYRLYTNQPDEMVTMMALASMKPGQRDFDPKLYQYGGLFVYPVGALLKACSLAHLITLKSDLTYYLDHPEAFGRFYVAARCYVATFGLAGVFAVFWIARRIAEGFGTSDEGTARVPLLCEQCEAPQPAASDSNTADTAVAHVPKASPQGSTGAFAGLVAALLYVLMPVVVNAAHEAKPHLPGAVLMLFAILAAIRYAERGNTRRLVITGILCGAAFGMVLSSWPVFVVIPLMTLLRRTSWSRRVLHAVVGCAVGIVIYFATNPYVLINLLSNPDVLRSNFGNTLAMFPRGAFREGLGAAAGLIAEGTSKLTAGVGLIAVLFLCMRAVLAPREATAAVNGGPTPPGWGTEVSRSAVSPPPRRGKAPSPASLWLLLAPAAISFVPFAAAGAGKPGEYGRFGIFVDIALAIAAAVMISRLPTRRVPLRGLFALVLALMTARDGYNYVSHFRTEAAGGGPRPACSKCLAGIGRKIGPLSIGMSTEPAPYCLPPVDVIGNRLFLLPTARTAAEMSLRPDIIVCMTDARPIGPFDQYMPTHCYWDRSQQRPARISWASRNFLLLLRLDGLDALRATSQHAH